MHARGELRGRRMWRFWTPASMVPAFIMAPMMITFTSTFGRYRRSPWPAVIASRVVSPATTVVFGETFYTLIGSWRRGVWGRASLETGCPGEDRRRDLRWWVARVGKLQRWKDPMISSDLTYSLTCKSTIYHSFKLEFSLVTHLSQSNRVSKSSTWKQPKLRNGTQSRWDPIKEKVLGLLNVERFNRKVADYHHRLAIFFLHFNTTHVGSVHFQKGENF